MARIKPPPLRDNDLNSKRWQGWFSDLYSNVATSVDSPGADNFASLSALGAIQDSGFDSTSFVRIDGVQDIEMTAPQTWKVGDGGTNYVQFASDGEITLAGTARVLNSYWIDAGGIKAPGAKPATEVAHGTLETPAWRFADAGAGNENSISWNTKIPNRMDRSVAPTVSIGWSSTTLAGNVRWSLEYLWTSEGESTAGAAQETLYVTGALSGVAEGFVVSTFTGIDVPSDTDVCMHCRLTRMSAAVEDTVADAVEFHGTCFQWTTDKLGTAT